MTLVLIMSVSSLNKLERETLYAPKLIILDISYYFEVFSSSFFPAVTHVLLMTFKEGHSAYQVLKGVI